MSFKIQKDLNVIITYHFYSIIKITTTILSVNSYRQGIQAFVYFTAVGYYLRDRGVYWCPANTKIVNTTECEQACEELGIRLSGKRFKHGKPCYKGRYNVCSQNGAFGTRASLICKIGGNSYIPM